MNLTKRPGNHRHSKKIEILIIFPKVTKLACYNKSKQQTFEGNSVRLWTTLDPCVGVLGFPVKIIIKADTKLTVVMCCSIFDERSTAPSSGNFLLLPPHKACGLSISQLEIFSASHSSTRFMFMFVEQPKLHRVS